MLILIKRIFARLNCWYYDRWRLNHDNIFVTLLNDDFGFIGWIVYSNGIQCNHFVYYAIYLYSWNTLVRLLLYSIFYFDSFYYRRSFFEHHNKIWLPNQIFFYTRAKTSLIECEHGRRTWRTEGISADDGYRYNFLFETLAMYSDDFFRNYRWNHVFFLKKVLLEFEKQQFLSICLNFNEKL